MLAARAGTPRLVVERLNGEMKRIMSAPEMQQRISNMGLIPLDPPSADETERYIKADVVNWQKILTSIGLAGSQ
jgi:tripartite-type tricarboxylate transporter receptor subunit TctC